MVDGHRKSRFVIICILLYHLWDFQLFHISLRHGHTNQPFAIGRHEVDVFRCGKFRRTDEVPLIFPCGVIRHQNDFARSKIAKSFVNSAELYHCLPS